MSNIFDNWYLIYDREKISQYRDHMISIGKCFEQTLRDSVLDAGSIKHLFPVLERGVSLDELRKTLIMNVCGALKAAFDEELVKVTAESYAMHEIIGEEVANRAVQ